MDGSWWGSVEVWPVVRFTLLVATLSTAATALPAIWVARCLVRRPESEQSRWRGRSLLEALVHLPLVLPPTAVGFLLLLLLGRGGPLGEGLSRLGVDVAFTPLAVVIACAVVSFPLFVRGVRGALEEIDPRLLQLARTLGRTPREVFWRVELPLAWRGVLAGGVMAFARALGEFGATILVAGNIPGRTQTLALALFQQVQTGNDRAAILLAGIAGVIAFVALLVVDRLQRRRDHEVGGLGRRNPGSER